MKRLIVSCLLLLATTADAKSQAELDWPWDQVWSAAVRFVRIDRGCKIVDKDESAAFLLFECEGDPGKPPRKGSLELYKIDLRGRAAVRVQVILADEPRYIELRFLELFERKVREERGPALPPRPPPAAPKPDGGA